MLSSEDLTIFRAAQEATMTSACTLSAPGTPTPDGRGGFTPGTPTETATTCRIAPLTGSEMEIAVQLQAVEPVMITLASDESIATGDKIIIGSATYQVVSVMEHGNLATAIRVMASRSA